ncbi:MAG: amidohydrolase, partial [Planctomycetota bacterium]
DQNDWAGTGFPDHHLLSAAVPRNPVAVTRIDGHALLANAAAMEAASITVQTKDPGGGRILRDASGNPTGVFVDAAAALIRRVVPPDPPARLREGIRLAIEELHRYGVTGIHDAGVSPATIDLYARMARAGEFDLRDYVMISATADSLDRWLPKGPVADLTGDGRITVRAIKMVADGALGSRGAALLEDYADEPGNAGLETESRDHIEAVAERALRSGFQLCVHAIGDRGNRNVLDAFEAALKKVPVADHRFRIEHAQVLHPEDLPRFAKLGVIPSMQAQHQTSDMYWAGRRLGPSRTLGAYAWRSLLDSGVVIPGGSDFPVEKPDPLAAYHAAVSRQDARNWPAGGWHPEQRMTRAEALAHLTIWPAYASFSEARLGSLRSGKLADLVVLSADLETIPVEELESVRVELTLFDGRLVYEDRP